MFAEFASTSRDEKVWVWLELAAAVPPQPQAARITLWTFSLKEM